MLSYFAGLPEVFPDLAEALIVGVNIDIGGVCW
jgi:hypothetical protein